MSDSGYIFKVEQMGFALGVGVGYADCGQREESRFRA